MKKYQKMIDNFWSVPEAIARGIPSSSIYAAIKTKKLDVYMRGSSKMIVKKEVLKLFKEHLK